MTRFDDCLNVGKHSIDRHTAIKNDSKVFSLTNWNKETFIYRDNVGLILKYFVYGDENDTKKTGAQNYCHSQAYNGP